MIKHSMSVLDFSLDGKSDAIIGLVCVMSLTHSSYLSKKGTAMSDSKLERYEDLENTTAGPLAGVFD